MPEMSSADGYISFFLFSAVDDGMVMVMVWVNAK